MFAYSHMLIKKKIRTNHWIALSVINIHTDMWEATYKLSINENTTEKIYASPNKNYEYIIVQKQFYI